MTKGENKRKQGTEKGDPSAGIPRVSFVRFLRVPTRDRGEVCDEPRGREKGPVTRGGGNPAGVTGNAGNIRIPRHQIR